jgi:ABC-type bacteriocin/lantibiotic exporter with double-glycine peptidase domain
MASSKKNIFRKLLDILKYEKEEISAIYFYTIFSGIVQLSLPLGIQAIISFVLGGAISTSLILLIIFVIAGVFIGGLLQVNQMKLIEKIQQQLFVRYSFQYAHTIPNLNLKDVDNYYLPELVNRFFDTISLQKGISKLLLDVPAATIQIIFGLILLSFYHPIFIFFGLMLLVVLYFILSTTGNRGLETSIKESDYKYKVAGYLQELARVITTLKFSRNNAMHIHKTDEYVVGYLESRTAHFKILLFQYWTLIGFKVVITSAMLIIGGFLLVNQQLNIGQFIAAEIVILMVIGSVEKLIINLDKVYDVLTSVEKITKVLEKPKEQAGDLILDDNEAVSIRAQNLSFEYKTGKQTLADLSFNINAGEIVCVQGSYTSGKSTLLRLLTGAFSNFTGSLLINNIPINNYEVSSLRTNTGIMLQMQDIFQGTLKANICMGEDNITYQEMDRLAEIVGLKPYIDMQREGYNLELQPAGQHLSGRIVKKILLMRALIHRPKLLLLEEPWLGLEEPYVDQIQDYLLHKLPGTTMLIVSNDEEFSKRCDKIIVLDNGNITSIIEN